MADVILIAGPTASGKSGLAVRLARAVGGIVANADSMQVYEGLHVLTARPGEKDMRGIDHKLYGCVAPDLAYSTGRWLDDARAVLLSCERTAQPVVFVGGTGLYFEALCGGLSPMPAVPDEIRERWRSLADAESAQTLHAILAERDPEAAVSLNPGDRQRILRALEVLETTGRSIRELQREKGPAPLEGRAVRKILLMPERDVLRRNIDRRFDLMVEAGACAEVEALLKRRLSPDLPVMKAIGVPQISDYLAQRSSLENAVERAKAASRQYAKRQATWFRNRFGCEWERYEDPSDVPDAQ